ncbi:FMN-dependent 2-nitropropane dioxygenase [Rostrohypoxylon terebratum]|nr:FMN-dependent 2-nitropropane dioxygenase [Rostrohypoxylon terebratum]
MNIIRRGLATMANSRMRTWFPGTEYPLIISAPMDGVTNPRLATEVTKAGGLGFIQGGRDFSPTSPILKRLEDQLALARELLGGTTTPLPIGVGFVTFSASVREHFATAAVPILKRYRPAAIWLFAPAPDFPETLFTLIKTLKSDLADGAAYVPKIAVQVGSVAAAREAVAHGADIVVAQGTDAGGHQWASGASVVSLVPEVRDMLDAEFPGKEIVVWAAGGIADGRGVAAALALGAEGGVLGTRYMVATESDAQDFRRKALLSATDGGNSTVKSQLHDHIQGNRSWPDLYDGRAIITPTYDDHVSGVSLDENTKKFEAAKQGGDSSRMVTWSGTGVGLVREELPAAEITKRVRDGALKAIKGLNASL